MVKLIIDIEKRCDAIRARILNLQEGIVAGDIVDVHDRVEAITDLERNLSRLTADKDAKLRSLAVEDRTKLQALRNSPVLRDRVNARAIHARLISRLQNRRFELQYLDRPYQAKPLSTSSSGK